MEYPMTGIKEWIERFDPTNGVYWTLLAVGVVLSAVAIWVVIEIIRRIRKGEPAERADRNLKILFFMALGINAEAMFKVATEKVGLTWWFALLVFAFFEAVQLHFMAEGKRTYAIKNTPGNAGIIVWFVAIVSSLVTLMNAHNAVEATIRIVLPMTVAAIWHLNLVAARTRKTEHRFRNPLREWLITRGYLRRDQDETTEEMLAAAYRHRVRKLVALSHRIERGGLLRKRRIMKLKKVVMVTEPMILDAAVAQLDAGRRGVMLLVPMAAEEISKTDRDINDLLAQLDEQSGSQSPSQLGSRLPTSQPQLGQSVGPVSYQSGPDQSDYQLTDQSDYEQTSQSEEPEAVIVAALRQAADGSFLSVQAAIRVITPPGAEKRCGPERAKRLLTKAGLTWVRGE
jgi:hypothetical protein